MIDELKAALTLDDNDSDVHRILAAVNVVQNNLDQAVYHQERALSLNPNNDLIVVQQGEILTWLGRAEEGVEWIKKAMRLNPYHPERFWSHLARAYFVGRRYADAIDALKRVNRPDHMQHVLFAACYAELGNASVATLHVEEALKREPGLTATNYLALMHYKQAGDLAHHREAVLKAGLPE